MYSKAATKSPLKLLFSRLKKTIRQPLLIGQLFQSPAPSPLGGPLMNLIFCSPTLNGPCLTNFIAKLGPTRSSNVPSTNPFLSHSFFFFLSLSLFRYLVCNIIFSSSLTTVREKTQAGCLSAVIVPF